MTDETEKLPMAISSALRQFSHAAKEYGYRGSYTIEQQSVIVEHYNNKREELMRVIANELSAHERKKLTPDNILYEVFIHFHAGMYNNRPKDRQVAKTLLHPIHYGDYDYSDAMKVAMEMERERQTE